MQSHKMLFLTPGGRKIREDQKKKKKGKKKGNKYSIKYGFQLYWCYISKILIHPYH